MAQDVIPAEVTPVAGMAVEAATALQRLGFKVLHVADCGVSIQAPEDVWRAAFAVTFEPRQKERVAGVKESAVRYLRPVQDPVPVPPELASLVAAVAFAEPPAFF